MDANKTLTQGNKEAAEILETLNEEGWLGEYDTQSSYRWQDGQRNKAYYLPNELVWMYNVTGKWIRKGTSVGKGYK